MTKPTKAALLSALLFPGVGQFVLKRYWRGVICASTAAISLCLLVVHAVESAIAISDKLISGEVAIESHAISELVAQAASGSDRPWLNVATYALLGAWLYAVIDACLVGKAKTPETGRD